MNPALTQVLRRLLGAGVIQSMSGKFSNKWVGFINQALASGYGIGEVVDWIQQQNESPGRARVREQVRGKSTPTSFDLATAPQQPGQLGRQIASGVTKIAPATLLMQALGGGGNKPQPEPSKPNAFPQNQQNEMAKLAKKQSDLSLDALAKQRQEHESKRLDERIAQGLEFGRSPKQVSEDIRALARKKENKALAKELSTLSKASGMKLEDYISSKSSMKSQEAQVAADNDIEAALAQLNQLMDELSRGG